MIAAFFLLLCFAAGIACGAQTGAAVYDRRFVWATMWAMLAFINALGVGAWALVLCR